MKFQLPTPLPYDVVDKMIDEKFAFSQAPYGEGGELLYTSCWRRDLGPLGNYDRMLAETIDDISKYEEMKYQDEDGYIEWHSGGSAMEWTATWTDADTEERWTEIFSNEEFNE